MALARFVVESIADYITQYGRAGSPRIKKNNSNKDNSKIPEFEGLESKPKIA